MIFLSGKGSKAANWQFFVVKEGMMKTVKSMSKMLLLGSFLLLLTLITFTPVNYVAAEETCTQPPGGMINWWPGDGHANDIQDGNHGTLVNGATFAEGMVGPAFSFDGADDYVSVPDNEAWAFGDDPFSIDLWVKFNEVRDRVPFIAHSDEAPEVSGEQNKWIFWFDAIGHGIPGNALRFHINSPTLGPVDPIIYPWTPNSGQWYHVAITRSGTTYALYIDGAQVATATDAHTIQDASLPLTIGQTQEQYFLNGRIDEVEIFNRALSEAEIQAIYNAGSAGKCKPATGQMVEIDIRPDSDTNPINLKSNGTIPVAILSTSDFDAPRQVKQGSLTFGHSGNEDSLHRRGNGKPNCDASDVNHDGLKDLVCHFTIPKTGFQPGDTEGVLKGQTREDRPIEGRDSIQIVP